MKKFREMIIEGVSAEEIWTKEDLIELISELDEDDIAVVSNYVLEILSYDYDYDWDEMEDTDWSQYDYDENIEEKMSIDSKRAAAKRRRKPTFKKAQRLKKKCMSKYGDKVRKTANSGVPFVCSTDGKLHKGMKKADRRKLLKTRKKNKNKIIK